MGGLHIDEKNVGHSISQWLPCPLAIWNLLFGMAILLNLVKSSLFLNSGQDPRHVGASPHLIQLHIEPTQLCLSCAPFRASLTAIV